MGGPIVPTWAPWPHSLTRPLEPFRVRCKPLSDENGWTVRATGDLSAVPERIRGLTIPARVPGCIHTDLMGAGLIGDPAVGFNEREVQWIGESDWEYRLRFQVETDWRGLEPCLDLVCEGLDTIA